MESLNLLSNADFIAALDQDGDGDVTWEEALPIFQAQVPPSNRPVGKGFWQHGQLGRNRSPTVISKL